MNTETIKSLKTETKNNPVATAVFYLLALRKRNRRTLTVHALNQSMRKEGFVHSIDQYRAFLKAMANAGVGIAIYNKVGNCTGIKDIKVNLMELGKAACESKELIAKQPTIIRKIPARRATDNTSGAKTDIAFKPIMKLEVDINGSPAVIQFPNGLSPKEFSTLVEKLQGGKI